MSTISEIQQEARETAVAHGFVDASFGERIALIHSEASEALEDYRNSGLDPEHQADLMDWVEGGIRDLGAKNINAHGVVFELADIVIRVCDMAEAYGLDLERAISLKMKVNRARPFRHGGKRL